MTSETSELCTRRGVWRVCTVVTTLLIVIVVTFVRFRVDKHRVSDAVVIVEYLFSDNFETQKLEMT